MKPTGSAFGPPSVSGWRYRPRSRLNTCLKAVFVASRGHPLTETHRNSNRARFLGDILADTATG